MAIRFLNTVLSGSLNISGSYTLPNINTSSTPGVLGQLGINGEVPHYYGSQGWQAISGSKFTPIPPAGGVIQYLVIAGGGGGGDDFSGSSRPEMRGPPDVSDLLNQLSDNNSKNINLNM